jgi:[ribosomal protein S5]-alanine N-acetyltransferase
LRALVHIRPLSRADEAAFIDGVRKSRSIHHPWVSPPDSREKFRAYLSRMKPPDNHAFLVCRHGSEEIVGSINITHVVMGPFCSGYLSYYVFRGHERQGLMREGLKSVVRHAFKELHLHRLEANIQPGNEASIALVRSIGFSREGFSPRYLKVGGRWRDHERWAIVSPVK